MGTLIDALLRLSRVTSQPIVFTNVDLSAIAKETISELQQTEPERHVEVIIQDGLTAHADAALIRILLSNLLGNAWKFTSKTQAPSIRFEALRSNTAECVFVVSDNGIGFDMAYADKLFSPFQRLHTETEFPGTGIGLSLVQRIIIRHGGKIWAKASPDHGAQFFFTLGDGNEKSTSETSTILLVEDNPDDEELTIAALKNSGITNRSGRRAGWEGSPRFSL